uniref:Potassium channel n=1 Tax=Kalanchoe fedtschenkoi TaxID=63787 RepID=A0A7N0UWU2_KALFE
MGEAAEDGIGRSKSRRHEIAEEEDEEEYVVDNLHERIKSSRGSRFNLLNSELGIESALRSYTRESFFNGIRDLSDRLVIHPDNRWYRIWTKFILIWAVYSTFFTPMEFGFFRGLPKNLKLMDVASQLFFMVDIVLQFFVAYRDSQTYRMVYKRNPIALRYVKSTFVVDLLGCMPWDIIYKAWGHEEVIRYFLWLRLSRLRKVTVFFQNMEKDIRINYLFTRIVKLIVVELYCTHTAACIFYYLATTLPSEQEGYTWIGSLKMGDYSYSHFRDIDIWTRYTTSLYFAIVTMATVGYGDIHAVNLREMIFIMIYVSFDMILGAYLIGNMTALIVKGSKTERFRDKMTDVIKYMNRNRLGRDIRNQIKGHLRLQYEASYTDAAVLRDIPASIRAKISQTLYKPYVEQVTLFKGCSSELINQVVIKVHEEFFLPGELIMEQGHVVDQLYFVCHGVLEVVITSEDGSEELVSLLQPNSSFGEISILCNIPHPYTVRVRELCRLLRLDKQSFMNILEIYFYDGRKIYNNILEEKDVSMRVKQVESDITFHIGKQEAELALKVNNAAYFGDLYQLKSLIRAGADPKKTDYDGRTPLHLASSRGYEDIVLFLIQEGIDVDIPGKLHFTVFPSLRISKILVPFNCEISTHTHACRQIWKYSITGGHKEWT